MHGVLYVCIRRSDARSRSDAICSVRQYLIDENFDDQRRFSGHCDYFSVGGRWSGRLTLLKLRGQNPQRFSAFWKQFQASTTTDDSALFRRYFPTFRGKLPFSRDLPVNGGQADDAQIMDASLFSQLKKGFSEDVSYSSDIAEPNVIFTDDPDDSFDWPKTETEASRYWVVVIDYHF